MKKVVDNPYFTAEMVAGIVEVQYKPGLHITLREAKEIVTIRQEAFGEIDYPVLLKTSRIKTVDKAARRYFFNEGLVNFKAIAMVQTSKLEKILTTVILTFDPPSVPMRVFESEDEARTWLKEFI